MHTEQQDDPLSASKQALCPRSGMVSKRTTWVPCRLRQENNARIISIIGSDECPAITFEVAAHQMEHRSRDGNVPHPSALGGFWTDGENPACPIDVIDAQGHEFFSPQRSIVRQEDHRLGTSIFMQQYM